MTEAWRRCSTCKQDIAHGATFYECSVSTCNSKRMGLFFCAVECWSAHVPEMRHRDAWAVEKRAPTRDALDREVAREPAARAPAREAPRRVVSASSTADAVDHDILVVASKLKKYIKARSGMNTSENVLPVLSDLIRAACDRAIRRASEDGRRTVMNRDFESH